MAFVRKRRDSSDERSLEIVLIWIIPIGVIEVKI